MKLDLTGLVLAGGQSRRMKQDKALLKYQGETLLSRAVETLDGLCPEVFICSTDALHQDTRADRVPDLWRQKGPLAAIASGLARVERPWALILACDMPNVSAALFHHLLQELDQEHEVFLFQEKGRMQPLAAIYARDLKGKMFNAIEANQLGLLHFLTRQKCKIIQVDPAWAWYDSQIFQNFNHSKDIPPS